ncbi:ribonuclease HII [Acidisoma cellulosilytica]|uniref:Ribonuclease HII n=1 Tax=Acidisoma cellulosilyticum TaxID=2802395 RepID=A0A963YZ25_9PROT|nr:ribonuclease HII [Acidisoma cellulosilyticum]MCB8878813.1 ribonuclease HII [Acidisoma cellulosilyticum]
MAPHFKLEKAAGGRVAGVDEVGRGPLAGPVVAAAVVFPKGVPKALASLLDDSKKLTAARREAAYAALRAARNVEIGVGAASVTEIEDINILRASHLAMQRAMLRLPQTPDSVLVDGNMAPKFACPAQCVVGGDATSLSIAAASIIAKVIRDRLMARLAARYPHYGWERNAGYGTAVHCRALAEIGVTLHHRRAFAPVRALLQETLLLDVPALSTETAAPWTKNQGKAAPSRHNALAL